MYVKIYKYESKIIVMDTFELQDFNKRIGLNTDLKNISQKICESYNLGEFISNELITIGYEDYNCNKSR